MELSITEQAHLLVREVLQPGDTAIDATCGNGHDTEFLSRLVGPDGRVFAFDVQEIAIHATAMRVAQSMGGSVTLFHVSHAEMLKCLPVECRGLIAVVMFNLGYLPGSRRSVTTLSASTRVALEQACQLLRPGGMVSIVAYTGHAGGQDELQTIRDFVAELPAEFTSEAWWPQLSPQTPIGLRIDRRESTTPAQ